MASNIKTGLSETTLRKSSSPGSLGVTKLSRIMTQRSLLSPNHSSANRSRKVPPTPPEESLSTRTHTPRLIQLKIDLRKANELIASLEDEKAKALDELEQVREEAYEKALEAQKTAEIDKFKAVEAGVEALQRKDEELEVVKNQHASDSALLLLVTRELEKVTQELASDNKMVAIHEEKVDILSSELIRLKAMLDSAREKETIAFKQIAVLKNELENARRFEAKVKEGEKVIEKFDGEIEVLTMCKAYAQGSADQWRHKTMELEELLEGCREEGGKLMSELETLKEEKKQGLKREEDANSRVQILLEEKSGLFSALRNACSESRALKEKLLSLGGKDYETQLEHYKKMLEEARGEIDVLVGALGETKMREGGLVNHVKRFDEEVCSMRKEMNRLGGLVKRAEEEADGAREKEAQMRDELKEVEDEVICLQETLREARGESLKLNAKMLDKETEFQSVLHENDDSMKKIKELSKLLEEALGKKHREEDESEQDYDLLPKVVEFSEEEKEDGSDDDETVEVEYSMWESYHTGKKEAFQKGK